jgi:hypothetical protein
MRREAIGSGLLMVWLLAACAEGTAPSPEETASADGTWSGTVTRIWKESVEQSGEGVDSLITQSYEAVVQVSSIQADVGAWELAGNAEILSSFKSDYKSRTTTPLGPCNVHYTDDAKASGSVQVEGGLEAGDGFYQFHLSIPGLDGSNDTVRDDSGCRGPNNIETTPWSVAPITAAGSGDLTDPDHISGSTTEPREGGEDTVTWDLTRTP